MVWLPLEHWQEQRTFWIGLKSREPKRCRLRFQPLCISGEPDWNPRWEEWHCYLFPLAMGIEDYQLLLADYFARIYPTQDAFSGTPEEGLDPCGPNWLGSGDWEKLILLLREELGRCTKKRARFYEAFLRWLEAALTHTDIIVVEGNQ